MSESTDAHAATRPLGATRPVVTPTGIEGPLLPNRPAAVSCGIFAGWLAAGICKMGIVSGILAGFGISGFVNSQVLWGLGWSPVVGLFSITLILSVSYLLTRRMFATQPRDVAVRTYWQVVRTTSFTAGAWFVGWVVLAMTVIYGVGGGAVPVK